MTRQTCVGMLLVLLAWVPMEAKAAPQSAASQSAKQTHSRSMSGDAPW